MTLPVNLGSTQPSLKLSGLSGFKTEEIVSALMSIERQPVTRLGEEAQVRGDEESALRGVLSSLQLLATNAGELALPAVFSPTQTVSSSESSKVSATLSGTAAIGAHEVTVSGLASAAQRSFTYVRPAEAQTVTIDGHELKLAAGETAAEFASAINANSELTVYAGTVGEGTLVLSERSTGKQSPGYIAVSSPGGALTEKGGTAREGTNAEYTVDGVEGSSASNTLTEALPGATLTLLALTSSPVTINVTAPTISTEKVKASVKAFVSQYNSTLAKLQSELQTKPASELRAESESGAGTLFADNELGGLVSAMRQSVDTAVSGLSGPFTRLEDIGVGGGSPTENPSQSSIEGQLTLEESKLEAALRENPEGVRKLLEGWGSRFQETVETYSAPGSVLESRIQGVESQVTSIDEQINSLDEALAVRQHALERTYAALEAAIRQAHSQGTFLAGQLASLGGASSTSSESSIG